MKSEEAVEGSSTVVDFTSGDSIFDAIVALDSDEGFDALVGLGARVGLGSSSSPAILSNGIQDGSFGTWFSLCPMKYFKLEMKNKDEIFFQTILIFIAIFLIDKLTACELLRLANIVAPYDLSILKLC